MIIKTLKINLKITFIILIIFILLFSLIISFVFANNENEVAVGEQVVTSNISSKYLQGLLVGYISEVNVDSNNLTRSGYIIPATDFKELQEVLVITTTKQDLIDGKGESGSDNGGE